MFACGLILHWAGEAKRLTPTYIVDVQAGPKSASRRMKNFPILAKLLAQRCQPVTHSAEPCDLSDALGESCLAPSRSYRRSTYACWVLGSKRSRALCSDISHSDCFAGKLS
jgi:hypothetical protein